MPPRKSNISQLSATDPDNAGTALKERDGINIEVPLTFQPLSQHTLQIIPSRPLLPAPPRAENPPDGPPFMDAVSDMSDDQDLSLPRTMVQRLAKGVLPPNTSLGKDAIVAMQKGATVFINYLAQAANTSTTNANKRTIPPPAVLEALVDLEFEAFVPRVEAELKKYNEVQVGKRNEYRRRVKVEKEGGVREEEEGEEEGRERKRARRGNGGVGEEGEEEGQDGHEQLQVGGGYGDGDEDEDGDGEGGGDEGEGQETGDERREGREGEEEEEEEEEGNEDDEDEYPDEGRRLSSVEREAHEGTDASRVQYDEDDDDDPIEGEDEEGLSDASD